MFTKIEALNYRCLRYVSQDLGQFHVLVGPNGSGKSSFLDVLALMRDFFKYGPDDALLIQAPGASGRARSLDELIFRQEGHEFELAVELRIPDDLLREHKRAGLDYGIARYEVLVGEADTGEIAVKQEALWLCPDPPERRGDSPQRALTFPSEPESPATLIHPSGEKHWPDGWRRVVSKTPTTKAYYRKEAGAWHSRFHVGPRDVALAGMPGDQRQYPVAIWVRDRLKNQVHSVAFDANAMKEPCGPSARRTFSPDGSNLPVLAGDLKAESPDRFEQWFEHIRTVLPELRDVEVIERPDGHRYLQVTFDSGSRVPSWLLSDGTLRMMALTLIAYLPNNTATYLIEEPENGVHPMALEAVFQSLSSLYDGQVLIATHSPMILGRAERQQILCFAKNESGSVDIVSGDKHPRLRDWRGQVELSTLYAAGVLG